MSLMCLRLHDGSANERQGQKGLTLRYGSAKVTLLGRFALCYPLKRTTGPDRVKRRTRPLAAALSVKKDGVFREVVWVKKGWDPK
jgi:hypothetical protein